MSARVSYILILCMLMFALYCCKVQHRISYNMPPGSTKEQQRAFAEKMEKGKLLYKHNCSDCHGIFTQGLDSIPNFTHTQVDNYSAAYLRGDPKNHAVAMNMSPEQFKSIMDFLSARKVDTSVHQIYQPRKPVVDFK